MPDTEIEAPSDSVVGYMSAFGLSAVVIVSRTGGSRPVVLATTADIGAAVTAAERRWPRVFRPAMPAFAYWCPAADAERIVAGVLADLQAVHSGAGLIQANSAVVAAAIQKTSRRLDVPLTVHDAAMRRATASTKRIESTIEGARQAGALQWFNVAYAKRRRAAAAAGRPFPTYNVASSRLRQELAAEIARSMGATNSATAQAGILRRVFGD